MRIMFTGEIISNLKHSDGKFVSCVEWKRNNDNYTTKDSVYIEGRYEIGKTVYITISDELNEPSSELAGIDLCSDPDAR